MLFMPCPERDWDRRISEEKEELYPEAGGTRGRPDARMRMG